MNGIKYVILFCFDLLDDMVLDFGIISFSLLDMFIGTAILGIAIYALYRLFE